MPDLGVTQLVIGFLLLLTPVVYFHELGHYWMARKAGVVVEVFSIGFGPEIYGWNSKKTGTRWRIAADLTRQSYWIPSRRSRHHRP